MPVGFEAWDEFGNLIVGVNDRITRILGVFQTTTSPSSGSIVDPRLLEGVPFYQMINFGWTRFYPSVTISGDTISWTNGIYDCEETTIFYGLY